MTGTTFTYPEISLGELLRSAAQRHSDRTAVSFMGRSFTYPQLYEMSARFADSLRARGVKQGERLAILLPNCPQYLVALFGAAMMGAAVVQINPMVTPRELDFILQDASPASIVIYFPLLKQLQTTLHAYPLKSIITVTFLPDEASEQEGILASAISFEELLDQAAGIVPKLKVEPKEDLAVLQYTGGTTGRAKGAMLTHANLVANASQNADRFPDHLKGETLRILAVIPFFHVYGLSVCALMGIVLGAHLVILPRFKVEEVLKTVEVYQPQYFPAVPTMLIALLHQFGGSKPAGWNIEFCNVGSAPMPKELLFKFEELTGTRILEGYGLTEASPVTHCNSFTDRKIGSVGRPIAGTEAKIMDLKDPSLEVVSGEVGELVVRGPQVMKGYWNLPDESAAVLRNGWLYTGDLAKMDHEGYCFIVDRKKDLILAGGFNVYPREVEEVLYLHPHVLEAAVVGISDPYRGETVKAFIVKKPGALLTEDELQQFCRQQLSAYKVPRSYEFRDTLPKTAVGKILRRVLAEQNQAKQ